MKKIIITIFLLLTFAFSLTACDIENLITPSSSINESIPPISSNTESESSIWNSETSSESTTESIIESPTESTEEEKFPITAPSYTLNGITVLKTGIYNDKDHVALYIYAYRKLPSNYRKKSEFNKNDYTSKNLLSTGGDRFYNNEGLLPEKAGRIYTECDIDYRGGNRNAKRIVFSNDWLIYYTSNHYESFTLLYGDL